MPNGPDKKKTKKSRRGGGLRSQRGRRKLAVDPRTLAAPADVIDPTDIVEGGRPQQVGFEDVLMAVGSITRQGMENVVRASRGDPYAAGKVLQFVAEVAPGTGDVIAAHDASEAFEEGRLGAAAFHAATILPFIGDIGQVLKGAGRRLPRALDQAQREILEGTAKKMPGAAKLSDEAEAARVAMQQHVLDYSMRPDNSAPVGQFGRSTLTGKADYDEGFGEDMGRVFENLRDGTDDPATRAAYEAMAREVDEQFDFVTQELGIQFLPTTDDPYKSSKDMMEDVLVNRRLKVYASEADHPLLGEELNVKFRFIHDVLGHAVHGASFARHGEESAFRAHSELFSPEAVRAMATETRGQNSWFNMGPHRDLPASERPFAQQKPALWPEDLTVPETIPLEERSLIPEVMDARRQIQWEGIEPIVPDVGRNAPAVGGFGARETVAAERAVSDIDHAIAQATIADGGTTYNPREARAVDPGRGERYAVGAHEERGVVLDGQVTPEDIAAFRADNADLLLDDDAFVGTWFNPEDGKTYLDVSRVYGNKRTADLVARDANQQSFFDLQSFADAGDSDAATIWVKVPDGAKARAELRKRADNLVPSRTAARREAVLRGLTDQQREQFLKMPDSQKQKIEDIYSLMPRPRVGASLALLGGRQRGWYEASGETLREIFGDDAPRFAALLAAQSPKNTVEQNLLESLRTWQNWVEAGRPQGEALAPLMRRAEEGGIITSAPTTSHAPNVQRVLDATDEQLLDPALMDEGSQLLSGPKVDPFFANIVGSTQRLTLDAHMAKLGPTANSFGSPTRKLGFSAATRGVADELERLTDVRFDPREIQEMQWSALKAMSEQAGRRGSVEEAIFGGQMDLLTGNPLEQVRARMEGIPSFATELQRPKLQQILDDLGLPSPTSRGPQGIPEVAGAEELVRPEDIREVAQRIDMTRAGDFLFALPFLGLGGAALANQSQ